MMTKSPVNSPPSSQRPETFDHEVLRKKLSRGEVIKLCVVSDSMEPLIKTGEEISIGRPKPLTELDLFDIVLFRQGNRLNAHFLSKIDRQSDVIITRPLKDPRTQDYPIQYEDIFGMILHKKVSWWQKLRVLLLC